MLWVNMLAFFAFCGISSSIYILNDIADIEADRVHKKKRYRPLASGEVTITEARIFFVFLMIATFAVCYFLSYKFTIVVFTYFIINLLYSFYVKNVVLLDVFFISLGFMLRVAGGAFAIEVTISSWMILTTIFISLFLAISKRRAELSQSNSDSLDKQRKVLNHYTISFTDQLNTIAATGTILSYALYTVSEKTISTFHSDKLIYTTPFVIYGIFRYMYLTHQKNMGESPTQIVTKDLPIIVNALLWLLMSFFIIYKERFGF
jgi:4-hydroxybenzoate polyprenyltransferase